MSASNQPLRLGVNLDHVATIRQVRGTIYPDLSDAICEVEQAGGDGITLHLREDRRHIQDADLYQARQCITTTLNMEMAMTDEMLAIACDVKPNYCCIVPEKRQELTTEGGLDVIKHKALLSDACRRLQNNRIVVSLFVEPDLATLDCAAELGAQAVELHTGNYANANDEAMLQQELQRLTIAAEHAHAAGLTVNAGHGLRYDNVAAIAAIPYMHELNIGHAIVADALFVGLAAAVRAMKAGMNAGVA